MTDFQSSTLCYTFSMKLICPICQSKLNRSTREAICENNHHFDYAKQGYINLYRSNKPFHGDNIEMVKARTAFLEKGIYAFLKEYLVNLNTTFHPEVFVDLGCGEGYYTDGFIAQEKYGFDLSKDALKHASKNDKSTQYVVASIFHLPIEDESCDVAVTCFAPAATEELQRILKPGGKFIFVTPGPKHLFEMKAVLYDTPYENIMEDIKIDLQLIQDDIIENVATLDQETLYQLFQMTPYAYKTAIEDKQRLLEIQNLDITCQFRIRVYEKASL